MQGGPWAALISPWCRLIQINQIAALFATFVREIHAGGVTFFSRFSLE
jgi:hypothetical protein